ncbi:membrane hypothetical protein [Alphaproteobacteria bacterium]
MSKNFKKNKMRFMQTILAILFFFTATITGVADVIRSAYADEPKKNYADSDIVKVLCNAVDFIAHGPGKVVAMLILISLAIALFLGKVTWGLAIAVGVGIGLMMGASNIMMILSGDSTDICAQVKK